MPLQPLNSLLKKAVRRANIAPQVEAMQIFQLVLDFFQQQLRQDLNNDLRLQTWRHGALTMQASSSALVSQLRAYETEAREYIVQAYQKKYGYRIAVHELRYRLR